jgi:hypothetical protein
VDTRSLTHTLQAKPRQPKPPKLAKIEQHQFYPLRLTELQDQEIASQCLFSICDVHLLPSANSHGTASKAVSWGRLHAHTWWACFDLIATLPLQSNEETCENRAQFD